MFIAYLEQGGGCDYTIGCGTKLITLESTTYNEALAELQEIIIGEYSKEDNRFYDGYEVLSNVKLFEVSKEHKIPLDTWYATEKEIIKEGNKKKLENEERAEFKRLKNKFGDK